MREKGSLGVQIERYQASPESTHNASIDQYEQGVADAHGLYVDTVRD
jgi:hypothetical protein